MRALSTAGVVLLAVAVVQPPTTRLAPANARLTKSFRAYSMNRMLEPAFAAQELSDGRVLITADRRFLVGDMRSGQATALPDSTGAFVSLSRDSSLIAARNSWRVLVAGVPVGQLPSTNPIVAYFRNNLVDPIGADIRGNLYTEVPSSGSGDSFSITRIERRTGAITRVATLALVGMRKGGVCPNLERAAYFSDGWIAIARAQPYRVDWLSADGDWIHGAPIETRAVPVTDIEKRIYHAWEGKDRERIFPGLPLDELVWPSTMCEWHSGYTPLAMPDGRAMIYRVPNSTMTATRYDVINRRGERERQVTMEPDQAIIGFGVSTVYVRTVDGSTATISRHPLNW